MRGFNIDTLPIGLDLIEARLNYAIGPHRILWNHRWAADKEPEKFVNVIMQLPLNNYDFAVIAIGPVERSGSAQLFKLKKTAAPGLQRAASSPKIRQSTIRRQQILLCLPLDTNFLVFL